MEGCGLSRAERVRGQKCVGRIFAEGRSGFVFPFRYHYLIDRTEGASSAAMMVSVPKKMFKRAVKRNLFKRRTREAYRLEKSRLTTLCDGIGVTVAFVYSSREEVGFAKMHSSMCRILNAIADEVQRSQNGEQEPCRDGKQ